MSIYIALVSIDDWTVDTASHSLDALQARYPVTTWRRVVQDVTGNAEWFGEDENGVLCAIISEVKELIESNK